MGPPDASTILLDHTQDIVVLLDEEGRITFANAPVERLLGWKPEELVGRNAFELVHPEDVVETQRSFEETIDADEFAEAVVEHRYRTSDGSWRWLESRMSNVTDEQLDGYVVSARDVTDRVRAETENRKTTARLEELTGATADVQWLFDGDWSEVLFVNPAYETVYGRPVEELESDPAAFLEAVHPDDVPVVESAMERLSAGNSVDLEFRVNASRDYRTWLWTQGVPIVEDGEVVRVAGFCKDITHRRRREIQLCVMENLLRHNLRNDMNIILGSADLLEAELPRSADWTTVIRRTGESLLASADKGREILKVLTDSSVPEQAELGDVVSAAIETVERRYPAAHVEFTVHENCSARVLPEFRYAVVELLENAIVHNERDERVVAVTLDRVDDRVVLTIEDDGPPMPEMEARVLDGDHEMTSVYHSTGLGLWLVYWIVELSDGWLDVQSDPEGGNCVRITLPQTGL